MCGTWSSRGEYALWDRQKVKTEKYRKNIWISNSQKHGKFDQRHKSVRPRSSTNSKKDKLKEIHSEIHCNQTSESQKYRENLDSSKRELTGHVEGILIMINIQFPIRNQGGQKTVGWHKVLKQKENCQPRILHSSKLSFKTDGEIKHSQINKSWGSSSPLYLLYKKCQRESCRTAVPNLFGTRDWFRGRQFFHQGGGGWGGGMVQAVMRAIGSDGERLACLLLTFCCTAQFLRGRRPVPVHGPRVRDPCFRMKWKDTRQ